MSTLTLFATAIERAPFELEGLADAVEVVGVGKAHAGVGAARALALHQPERVILLGVAGAYRSSGLCVRDLCVVRESVLADEGVVSPQGFESIEGMGFGELRFGRPPYVCLADDLSANLPAVCANTVSSCSGRDADAVELAQRTAAQVETMESAAVALACRDFGVPLVELRAVSNLCGERARGAWDVEGALDALSAALPEIIAAVCWPDRPEETA